MRSINLSSYSDSFKTLEPERFQRYMKFFGIEVKKQEAEDLFAFINEVKSNGLHTDDLSDFFVGYSIPQISKEIDLLRFGDNYNLDIELKNISSEDRIKKQLLQNQYYLKALDTPVFLFAYVVKTKQIYTLDESGNLITSAMTDLVAAVEGQKPKNITDIDSLFKPSVYLVSPLNSTEKFMGNSYFLNDRQLEIRNDVIQLFYSNDTPFVAIEGKPGTGKTLLTFDIAKHFIDKAWNVCLFHCGYLSDGHILLKDEYHWDIHPIKDIYSALQGPRPYDLIVVDETQRIWSEQFDKIIEYVIANKAKCIFSYDPEQVFTTLESNRNIAGKIELQTDKKYKLTEKIRTNKEIAAFIKNLFDKNKTHPDMTYKNIKLQYFDSANSLADYLDQLKKSGWEVINYTRSSYNMLTYDRYSVGRRNAHGVIGQEFDKVAAVINQYFYYNEAGKLMARREAGSPPYRLDKMLYQMLTRARQEITVIIYKNEAMLDACLKILGK